MPTPEEIKQARKEAGLTQTQAGKLIHKSCRAWQQYEKGDREMDLAYWELFLIKTNTQK
ncbi:MAG: helix-turn-helix domain-containing protein [Methylovulum sp.]